MYSWNLLSHSGEIISHYAWCGGGRKAAIRKICSQAREKRKPSDDKCFHLVPTVMDSFRDNGQSSFPSKEKLKYIFLNCSTPWCSLKNLWFKWRDDVTSRRAAVLEGCRTILRNRSHGGCDHVIMWWSSGSNRLPCLASLWPSGIRIIQVEVMVQIRQQRGVEQDPKTPPPSPPPGTEK